MEQQLKIEEEKRLKEEEFARRHRFLVSTAAIPGIYNSPHRVRSLRLKICFSHRRRLFILSTGAQLKILYQSNVNYRSKNVFTPIKHYRSRIYSVKPKFHLARLDTSRHVRRVEPMHFGCVDIVKQHSLTRST